MNNVMVSFNITVRQMIQVKMTEMSQQKNPDSK